MDSGMPRISRISATRSSTITMCQGWAFRAEDVLHLEDAMLRRTRLGLLIRNGAGETLERVGAIACAETGWNDARWRSETERYRALIARCYSLPADA